MSYNFMEKYGLKCGENTEFISGLVTSNIKGDM